MAYILSSKCGPLLRAGSRFFSTPSFAKIAFTSIHCPPNYSVFTGNSTDFFPTEFTINANEYTILANAAAAGGGAFTLSSSPRMLNNDLVTATSQPWNPPVGPNILRKGSIPSVPYVAARWDH